MTEIDMKLHNVSELLTELGFPAGQNELVISQLREKPHKIDEVMETGIRMAKALFEFSPYHFAHFAKYIDHEETY